MSPASERMRGLRRGPRRKAVPLSPELAEVLKILKALEEQPDSDNSGPDEASR